MNLVEQIGKIIADTNQPGRWGAAGRDEREHRTREADAIICHLIKIGACNANVFYKYNEVRRKRK